MMLRHSLALAVLAACCAGPAVCQQAVAPGAVSAISATPHARDSRTQTLALSSHPAPLVAALEPQAAAQAAPPKPSFILLPSKSRLAARQSTCYTVRSYEYAATTPGSDLTHRVGESTCVAPAERTFKSAGGSR